MKRAFKRFLVLVAVILASFLAAMSGYLAVKVGWIIGIVFVVLWVVAGIVSGTFRCFVCGETRSFPKRFEKRGPLFRRGERCWLCHRELCRR